MNSKIIRYTIFESNPLGHGGERRTAQISELLNDLNIEWEKIPVGMEAPQFSSYFLKKLLHIFRLFFQVYKIVRVWFNPFVLYRTLSLVCQFRGVYEIKKKDDVSVLFWEITRTELSFVIPLFKNKGFRIVAFPHNLESLVTLQTSGLSGRISPEWFNEEVALLKKCESVFTISYEEALLLRQYGIDANYLPYYPPEKTLEVLKELRSRRATRGSAKDIKKVLMIGSALNKPTKQGMEYIIDLIKHSENIHFELIIAGFGTSQMESLVIGIKEINVLGEITDEQLKNLIIGADCLLVHQPPTSGALTRIIEMLIAGVPVVANFNGGRNYNNMNGVHIYNSDVQLFELLGKQLPVPETPLKPLNEINHFKTLVTALVSKE